MFVVILKLFLEGSVVGQVLFVNARQVGAFTYTAVQLVCGFRIGWSSFPFPLVGLYSFS